MDVGKFPTVEAPTVSISPSTSRYSMQHRRQNSTPVVRQRFWGFKSLRPAPPLRASQIMQIREVWLLCIASFINAGVLLLQEKDKDKEKSTKSHKAFMNVTTSFKRESSITVTRFWDSQYLSLCNMFTQNLVNFGQTKNLLCKVCTN